MAYDPRIGRVFNFSAEELEANRAGRLGRDQEILWRNSVAVGRRRNPRVTVMVVVVLGVAIGATLYMSSQSPGGLSPAVLAVAGGLFLWVGALFGWALWRNRRSQAALEEAALRRTEGPFTWETSVGEFWWGIIGDARFGIDRLGVEVLEHGAPYRLWYLPMAEGAWVMSLERIEG